MDTCGAGVWTVPGIGPWAPCARRRGGNPVDTLGFIFAIVVHSASIQDRTGARAVLIRLFGIITHLRKIHADGGYTGKRLAWTRAMFGWTMELVKRNESGKSVVLPKRWIVERTFTWLAN